MSTSTTISAKAVSDLRAQTGAGFVDCKKALVESNGNVEKAMEWLRKKGMATAAKKASREAVEGTVTSYIHTGGRIGVLLQLGCETSFVAINEEFVGLGKDLCMHIAALAPIYVKREDVPEELVQKERQIAQAQAEGKPTAAIEKIVSGKLDKYFSEVCLLEQEYIKGSGKTVQEIINEKIAKIGENIVPVRFSRFQVN